MVERRSYPRLAIKLVAHFKIQGPFPSAPVAATIVNINPAGACLTSDSQVEPEQIIELKIRLTSKDEVSIMTRVMWVRRLANTTQYMAGVKMINTNREDEQKFIQFYCHKILALP